MMSVSADVRNKSYLVCRDYLNGAWTNVSEEDFAIKPLSGGLTNHIYLCELPPRYEMERRDNEPKKVLLRFYGSGKASLSNGSGPSLSHLTENLLCAILAERKLGPKLYGVFSGGRIEEYIPARSLYRRELSDPDISFKIAEKLGKIHALKSLPFNKEPDKMFDKMFRWLQTFIANGDNPKFEMPERRVESKGRDWKKAGLKREIDFCKKVAHNSKSPLVFCHCDLQEGNILIRQRVPHPCTGDFPTDHIYTNSNIKLDFIDYEYSSYTYRAFDLANHFCEWALDYSDKTYPYFSVHPQDYPSKEQQLAFIRPYMRSYTNATTFNTTSYKERNKPGTKGTVGDVPSPRYYLRSGATQGIQSIQNGLLNFSLSDGATDANTEASEHTLVVTEAETSDVELAQEEEEVILKEVEIFVLHSHLFWLIWALIQTQSSTFDFGFEEYAEARYTAYIDAKAELKRQGKTLFGSN